MSLAAAIRKFAGVDQETDYILLLSEGVHIIPRAIIGISPYNRGLAMTYRDGSGKVDVVYVPHDFKYLEKDGKYYLGKRAGNNSACAVLGSSLDKDCPGEDLSALVRAHGLALGFKALYERSIPWKLIIIIGIGVVAIIGLVAWLGPRIFG